MGYLDAKAVAVRARRATAAPRGRDLDALRERASKRGDIPSFEAALRADDRVALIAEFKRRSPSAGPLANEDPIRVASVYREAGAAALSVLTDKDDFGGRLDDLNAIATSVTLPALRKDFIVDAAGLYEARAAGAAATLLILRILSPDEAATLIGAANEIGLGCLCEVHDEAELDAALEAGASIVGINNRDLQALTTDLAVTERIAPRVPDSVTLVSESGIRDADDVRLVRDAGVDAVLVGESLLRLPPDERARKVEELAGVNR
ncbi:MAG: indole-3-glycerol-phosphate synthase [Gemmatimonadetes bacterium]|uniref:indole-3-glycerol-phosphate synthase n=1 Tax=Candidatus Kutchimonas denitrificans TaxID=3056748 RepID=A0AAE4Z7W3_9BACT|nr:indole-3-glycerol-phosphate synthase [Gemmatimonadota bacterium]NIR74322.1 indole-3-glycerol-phosphate synthase [Candidatus Kutchimonas denitrificans]NIS01378.1 indole-3-glycerol-phosphate synthase [Gemmatimonadota bacterium]NIT67118.1 indole-3-glycerol-phosphate synthase [Gemmatimonadota bacterium]NIU52774.1 indole-3-glycerol-phosphate synthase TrpC [Gemmatimonadota bacterium]